MVTPGRCRLRSPPRTRCLVEGHCGPKWYSLGECPDGRYREQGLHLIAVNRHAASSTRWKSPAWSERRSARRALLSTTVQEVPADDLRNPPADRAFPRATRPIDGHDRHRVNHGTRSAALPSARFAETRGRTSRRSPHRMAQILSDSSWCRTTTSVLQVPRFNTSVCGWSRPRRLSYFDARPQQMQLWF